MAKKNISPEQKRQIHQWLHETEQLIYHDEWKRISREANSKDLVILFGNTRSGKSTLINYLIGNRMRAVLQRKNIYKIEKFSTDRGPVIGDGALSVTKIPSLWASSRNSDLIVDTPGFNDNRGIPQDTANSFYIRELLVNANSAKFVLVCDIADILNDNIGQFISFLDEFYNMVPDCNAMSKGLVMVFNKDIDDTTKAELIEILSESILSQQNLDLKNKCLVQYLVNNPNNIIIVRRPEEAGEIPDETIFSDLVEVILKAPRQTKNMLITMKSGISDKSRAFLVMAKNYVTTVGELATVLDGMMPAFLEKLSGKEFSLDTDSINDLKMVKGNLLHFEERVSSLLTAFLTILESFRGLSQLLPNYEILKEDSSVYTRIKFISFIDNALGHKDTYMLSNKVNSILSKMKDKLVNTRIELQERLREILTDEARQKIDLQRQQFHKEQENINQQLEELQRQQRILLTQQEEMIIQTQPQQLYWLIILDFKHQHVQ